MEKYQPINCKYYDILELYASRKESCQISFFENEKSVKTLESIIEDIYTKNKEEFLKLKDGTIIRLDQIIGINDTQFYGHCAG